MQRRFIKTVGGVLAMACSMLSNLPTQICFQQIHYCNFCTKYTNALWKVRYFLHLPKVFAQIHSLQNNDYFFLPRISVRKAGMISISSRCTSRKWICMQGILGYKVSNYRCLSILIWYFLKVVFEFQVWKNTFLRKDHGIKNNWIFHWHIMSSSVLDTLLTFYCKPSRTLLQYHFRE